MLLGINPNTYLSPTQSGGNELGTTWPRIRWNNCPYTICRATIISQADINQRNNILEFPIGYYTDSGGDFYNGEAVIKSKKITQDTLIQGSRMFSASLEIFAKWATFVLQQCIMTLVKDGAIIVYAQDKDRVGIDMPFETFKPFIPKDESRFMRYLNIMIPQNLEGNAKVCFNLDLDYAIAHRNRSLDTLCQNVYIKKRVIPLIVSVTAQTNICPGDSSTLFATSSLPNSTFLWNTGAHTATIRVLSNGNYTVTVSNGTQTSVTPFTYTGPEYIRATYVILKKDSCGAGGQIRLTPLGGTPPYRVVWDTGDTLFTTIKPLTAGGPHKATITDSIGCSIVWNVIMQVTECHTATQEIQTLCDVILKKFFRIFQNKNMRKDYKFQDVTIVTF